MNFLESPTWAGILNFQGAVAQVEEDQWDVNVNERTWEGNCFVSSPSFFFFLFVTTLRRDKILCD